MPKTDPVLLARAKNMRSSPAEARRWYALRAKRFERVTFSHQVIIGRALVDFAARSRKLVIEVDGDAHIDADRDARRTTAIERFGHRVLRFSNAGVMGNLEGVLLSISEALLTAPLSGPLPDGEREKKE